MITRYVFAVGLGVVTTFALFLLMQALIKSDKSPFDEGISGKIVDFVRLQDDMDIQTKQRKPTPPPPPDEPPPDMPKPDFDSNLDSQGIDIGGDVDDHRPVHHARRRWAFLARDRAAVARRGSTFRLRRDPEHLGLLQRRSPHAERNDWQEPRYSFRAAMTAAVPYQ